MFAALKSGGPVPAVPKTDVAKPSFQPKSSFTSASSGNGSLKIKVYNIPEGTEEEDLKSHFAPCGEVCSINILPLREGKVTTLGFVTFASEDGVKKACMQKNNEEFNGSPLRVMEDGADGNNNRMGGGGGGGDRDSCQVKVFNIPELSEEESLRDHFSSVGEVTRVKILPCREGRNTTLGFVTFTSAEACQRASSELHEKEFNGSNIRVQFEGGSDNKISNGEMNGGGRPRDPQAKVFGVPEGTSDDEIRNYFSPAGEISSIKVLPRREGKDNCLAFVTFTSDSEVEKAVSLFDGQEFNGSTLKVMAGSSGGGSGGGAFSALNNSPWMNNASGPSQRLPRDENPTNGTDRSIVMPDMGDSMDTCRRCGETGHWAKECVNAPIGNGTMAVTYVPQDLPDTREGLFGQDVSEGINFDKYDCIPVELSGNNAPKPISSFDEAQLHEKCRENIKAAKYKKPTPVQKYAIPAILASRDVMACAQTGSGKTGAFLLPMITNMLNEGMVTNSGGDTVSPLVCIVAPTRELAVQIFIEARKFSFGTPIKPVVVYGGVSVSHQVERLQMGCHICVATPGRLDDFVKKGRISFRSLKYLVLDEADKMLDMGFGPQIQDIINNSEMPPRGLRVTLMFSATFPDEIQKMAAEFLNDYLFLAVGRVGGTCADVSQVILEVDGKQKRSKLQEILQKGGTDRTLVFVEKKKDADFLASYLSQQSYPATSMNADRSQQERENALADFRKGVAPVLVATAIAARGLDIRDVKHVINYDLPKETTEYVHRIGRTGRIGNRGLATSFFDADRDEKIARGLVKLLSEGEQEVPEWLEEIALRAVGTGYGPNSNEVRDQRSKPETVGSKFSAATKDEDEEEEW